MKVKRSTSEILLLCGLNCSKKCYRKKEGNPPRYVNAQKSVERFDGRTISLSSVWFKRDQFGVIKKEAPFSKKIYMNRLREKLMKVKCTNRPRYDFALDLD